jgi:hypothetical protein
MVVPGPAAQLDCEESEQSIGRCGLVGCHPKLHGDIGSKGTNVGADRLAPCGFGSGRWTEVPGVDARREREMGSQRTGSRRTSCSPERGARRGSTRRGSQRPARTDFESLLAASTWSTPPHPCGQRCTAGEVRENRGGISGLPGCSTDQPPYLDREYVRCHSVEEVDRPVCRRQDPSNASRPHFRLRASRAFDYLIRVSRRGCGI